MRRFLVILNFLLAAALVGLTAWWYTRLPERIPIHFDMSGQPDGWGTRASFIILPVIGLAVAALMAFVGRASVRNPTLVNMPGKKKLLALPPEAQRAALEPFIIMMDLMATLILLLFIVICISTYRAALGHDVSALIGAPLYVIIAAMLVAPIGVMISMKRRLDESAVAGGV